MRLVPRRSPRVSCALPVHWTRRRHRVSGEIRVCNVHGMFIATDEDQAIGYLMDLTIELPTGTITCTAVPRFVGHAQDGHGIGVELHVIDAPDRDLWTAYYRRVRAELMDAPTQIPTSSTSSDR